jgi:hypothetical protein
MIRWLTMHAELRQNDRPAHSVRMYIWRTLRISVAVYRTRPWLYLIMAVCIVIVCDAISVWIAGYRPFGRSPKNFGLHSLAGGTGMLLMIPIISGLSAYCIARLSREPGVSEINVGVGSLRVLPGLLVLLAVAYLGIGVAGIFFVVPGVVLWLRWFFVAPVITVERRSIGGALKRSAELVHDHYQSVLCLLLLLWVSVIVTTTGVHVILQGSGTNIGDVTIEVVVESIVSSYLALMIVVAYFTLAGGGSEDILAQV